jgi:uncharacterized membrane protein YphA (DoxX/SURF4 family)
MKRILGTTAPPILFIRLVVGLIFLSEGLQKYITPDATGAGRFAKIGLSHPSFWAYLAGSFEIICALFILAGLFIRFAAIPLLVVMIVAFVFTKVPILENKGFWSFAHEYRTDFAMTMLLIYLLIDGWRNGPLYKKTIQH